MIKLPAGRCLCLDTAWLSELRNAEVLTTRLNAPLIFGTQALLILKYACVTKYTWLPHSKPQGQFPTRKQQILTSFHCLYVIYRHCFSLQRLEVAACSNMVSRRSPADTDNKQSEGINGRQASWQPTTCYRCTRKEIMIFHKTSEMISKYDISANELTCHHKN